MSQLTDMIPEVAPEYHELLVKQASAVQEAPFREEILQEMDAAIKKAEAMIPQQVKTAGIGFPVKTWKDAGNVAKGTGVAFGVMTAGGVALALAADLYESAKRGLTKGRDFRSMLKANPDLGAASKAAKVKASFSTLHRFNPEFAKDPNVAGSYVRNSIDMPGSELASVKDLVKARSDSSKARQLPQFNPSNMITD